MTTAAATAESGASTPRGIGQAILFGGLTAGVLDALAAIVDTVVHGGLPFRMFQGIASALLGRASFDGGWTTALMGAGIHFCIATTMATLFVVVSLKWPVLRQRWILWGFVFGIGAHFTMRYAVLPMTAIRMGGFNLFNTVKAVLIHMFLVGLPIAYMARRFVRDQV